MTKISWTDATWNPTVGCARVSPGCLHCYAEHAAAMVNRTQGEASVYRDLVKLTGAKRDPRWTGKAKFLPERLAIPLGWRKPRRVFVDSMSDLFHDDITNEQIAAVLGVMAAAHRHTFQVLTKRPARMVEWFRWVAKFSSENSIRPSDACRVVAAEMADRVALAAIQIANPAWPLPNVHLGVSVENQAAADERIPLLLRDAVKAAVKFLSIEPLLGPVALQGDEPMRSRAYLRGIVEPDPVQRIDWVIAGCESGPGARPCDVAWLRSLRDQCAAAGVPYFLKQAKESTGVVDDGSPTGACVTEIGAGLGSHRKGGGVIELPYLDGVQHAAFPTTETT